MAADSSDEAQFRAYGEQLAYALAAALPGWVERAVDRRLVDFGQTPDPAVLAEARTAGAEAARDVGGRISTLLALDVDEQTINPLSLVRSAVTYPTAVLRAAGVPAVVRDAFAEERFPDDIYDLAPASFAEVDPSLAELGIQWGAAKAFVHRARHRGDGGRDPDPLGDQDQ